MKRYRIKTLLSSVWSLLDAEFETIESDTFNFSDKAAELQARYRIEETLENPALKGKQLVKEVESQVQELIRMKRQHAAKHLSGGVK